MYIKDLMINPIISLPVASFIVLSYQPLRTKNAHHTSCYCDHTIYMSLRAWTILQTCHTPTLIHIKNWQNIAGFKNSTG